ncbi:protein canopy homolog 1 isoform X1 [Bufo gargarizans]|uniref:protein canopy homolog 1 isoform X1 n=2 Tax=Bufo gargarizans TaxID=30331 RepID=UPI001CF4027D|nr:protein canopy homolog 1 isoform X1 [Bufo gargarizans]
MTYVSQRQVSSMTLLLFQIGIVFTAVLYQSVEGKRDPITYCGACRAMVDELLYEIRKVSPSKTIDVGSFRINPDGTQVQNKVPLVKSEVYLTEVLEGICEKMDDYSLYIDPDTKEKSFKRFAPRDNDAFPSVDFNNFQFNPGDSNPLKYACESVVEENDEEIISLIIKDTENFVEKLCNEVAGFCKDVPHSEL